MRLPLSIPFDSREGQVDQDGRMTNAVAEQYEDKSFVSVRPALVELGVYEGAANGIFCFNGQIVTVWGTTIEQYYAAPVSAYDAGTTYDWSDLVLYDGTVWISTEDGNRGLSLIHI